MLEIGFELPRRVFLAGCAHGNALGFGRLRQRRGARGRPLGREQGVTLETAPGEQRGCLRDGVRAEADQALGVDPGEVAVAQAALRWVASAAKRSTAARS